MDGVAARALEFLLLTAARTGEVLGAKWSEIDLGARTWTIPWQLKTGTKTKRPHVVPLADRALAIVEEMRMLAGDGDFVFPGRATNRPMNGMTLLQHLHRGMGLNNLTVHGLRSTFRDWVGDKTVFPRELAEAALGHVIGGVEGSYRRGDALDRRREMMNVWSAYCASTPADAPAASANVVPFERAS
jgi:integrase